MTQRHPCHQRSQLNTRRTTRCKSERAPAFEHLYQLALLIREYGCTCLLARDLLCLLWEEQVIGHP